MMWVIAGSILLVLLLFAVAVVWDYVLRIIGWEEEIKPREVSSSNRPNTGLEDDRQDTEADEKITKD